MLDISTYIIYTILLLFVVSITYLIGPKKLYKEDINDNRKLNIIYFLLILLLATIAGIRYEVGVDWFGYVTIFNETKKIESLTYFDQYYEFGFYILNRVIGLLDLGYQWVFFISAVISWYFYFKAVPKVIIPLFIFFLFVNEYFFWSMNGVRQFIAMGIFIYGVRFVINKNLLKYLLTIFGASLFHSSVLLFIPIYFLPYDKLYDRNYWFIAFIISVVVVNLIDLSFVLQNIEFLMTITSENIGAVDRYLNYFERGKFIARDIDLGLGFVFKLFVNGFIIWTSKDLLKYIPELKVYIIIFFIGALMFNLFYEYQLMGRLINYFMIFKPLILGYLIYFYWVFRKDRIIVPILIILHIVIFFAAIYGNSNMCCPYQILI